MVSPHYVYTAVIALLFGVSLFSALRAIKSGDTVDGILAGASLAGGMFMMLLRTAF
jgi:hypothetical protein